MRGDRMEEAKDLPPLTEYYYLDHLELFQVLYKAGRCTASAETEASDCLLQGVVIVISARLESAKIVADYIAEQLGRAKRIDEVRQVTERFMGRACERGMGYVCAAVVQDGTGGIRKLLTKYADFVSIVLFQCSEVDISGLLPAEEVKKAENMMIGWRKTRCARVIELPGSSLFDPDDMDTGEKRSLRPLDTFSEMLLQLKRSPDVDERPGILVFFPSVPGSGKSACVTGIDKEVANALVSVDNKPDRNIFVQVGDTTKEKFWPLVKRTRQRDCSCIYIADKNAPSSAWGTVANICSTTKALAVPVLPDASAIRTTRIVGMRKPDGSFIAEAVHIYPFSLQYLAVCIARVMERTEGSHAGKLDRSTARACMIVVKFFALYRAMSADNFFDKLTTNLSSAGALVTPAPIEIPFFRQGSGTKSLPEDLEQVLIEALRAQVSKTQGAYIATFFAALAHVLDSLRRHLGHSTDTTRQNPSRRWTTGQNSSRRWRTHI
jgi:hypothetical protein